MEIEFVNRVIKVTLILAGITFAIISFYYGLPYGLAILAGAGWGCVNLYFLKQLISNWLTLEPRDHLKIWTIMGIKFPILYLAGFGLLKIKYLPALNLLLGFSLILAVIFLKGLGRVFLGENPDAKKVQGRMNFWQNFFLGMVTETGGGTGSSEAPELPNFVTLLYHKFGNAAWAMFLHHWENIVFSLIIAFSIWLLFWLGSGKKP